MKCLKLGLVSKRKQIGTESIWKLQAQLLVSHCPIDQPLEYLNLVYDSHNSTLLDDVMKIENEKNQPPVEFSWNLLLAREKWEVEGKIVSVFSLFTIFVVFFSTPQSYNEKNVEE